MVTEGVGLPEIALEHDEYRYDRPTRSVTALQSPRTYRSSTPWVARRSMVCVIASKERLIRNCIIAKLIRSTF